MDVTVVSYLSAVPDVVSVPGVSECSGGGEEDGPAGKRLMGYGDLVGYEIW